jgi:23S rRNA pseudouridine2605 synthase
MAEERLQKILSRAGVSSRRKAESLMAEGRVTVNGTTITELGSKADLDVDHIKVDGKLLRAPRRLVYIALNKPVNCVTTVSDPEGRPTVMDLIHGLKERVFPVGRLDYHSEGLLLLTNDGEFSNALTAAAVHIPKTYLVKVNGLLSPEQEAQFRSGVPMEGRMTAPAELKMVRRAVNPWYEIKLIEGRKNQIRVMFKHFGRLVEKLKRVRIGFLELGPIKPGEFRHLSLEEIARFQKLIKRRKAVV